MVAAEVVEVGGAPEAEGPRAEVAPALGPATPRLTATQRKVLAARAAAPAATAGQLGAVLGVKDSTVRDTLSKLRRMFAVADDAALVRAARERSLLEDAPAVVAD